MKVAPIPLRTPTATYTVNFEMRQRNRPVVDPAAAAGRIPRVTRLLALAHRIDGMIRGGEIKDWAEAARLVGVTRARMAQVANLLLLAPYIQEFILQLPAIISGRDPLPERYLRGITQIQNWSTQHRMWLAVRPSSYANHASGG